MKVENKVVEIENRGTSYIQRTLDEWAKQGFKLVSTEYVEFRHGYDIIYLFFVRETN